MECPKKEKSVVSVCVIFEVSRFLGTSETQTDTNDQQEMNARLPNEAKKS